MIIRIVKMTFKQEKIQDFLSVFNSHKELIRAFSGCEHLELLQDINTPEIFMTYSYWQSEEQIEAYRKSDLFKEVWAKTKIHFTDKPLAWSVKQRTIL